MELADLRAFLRIAEERSISQAARVLGQPKSSISRGLARLEKSVGAALVDRSSQHLRLTDAGVLLRSRAAGLLDQADDVRAALDGLAEKPRGRLRISATYTFAVGLIAPMLSAFVEAYPDIQVVLDIDNKPVNLHVVELDLAIRIGALADSELVAQKLATVELWACASPAYLAEHGVPVRPADLADHKLIARTDGVTRWGFADGAGAEVDIDVRPIVVVADPAVMAVMARMDAGIARLPDFIARRAIDAGELVRVLPELLPDRIDVHALYTSRRALPTKARLFIQALVDHLRRDAVAPPSRATRPGNSTRQG